MVVKVHYKPGAGMVCTRAPPKMALPAEDSEEAFWSLTSYVQQRASCSCFRKHRHTQRYTRSPPSVPGACLASHWHTLSLLSSLPLRLLQGVHN